MSTIKAVRGGKLALSMGGKLGTLVVKTVHDQRMDVGII